MKREKNPQIAIPNFCNRMVGAVRSGDVEDVKFLLNENSRLATVGEREGKGPSVLEISLRNGDAVIATILCENKADISLISPKKKQEFAETIEQVDKNIQEKNDFINAVCTNDLPGARAHISQNKSLVHTVVNKLKSNEMSALEFVVGLGNYDMTELLVDNGANPSQYLSDFNGSLLHLCAGKNDITRNDYGKIYSYLVSKGADQTILDNKREMASDVRFIGPIDWRNKIAESRDPEKNLGSQACIMM